MVIFHSKLSWHGKATTFHTQLTWQHIYNINIPAFSELYLWEKKKLLYFFHKHFRDKRYGSREKQELYIKE
jgi:hypothetical protein